MVGVYRIHQCCPLWSQRKVGKAAQKRTSTLYLSVWGRGREPMGWAEEGISLKHLAGPGLGAESTEAPGEGVRKCTPPKPRLSGLSDLMFGVWVCADASPNAGQPRVSFHGAFHISFKTWSLTGLGRLWKLVTKRQESVPASPTLKFQKGATAHSLVTWLLAVQFGSLVRARQALS